MNMEAILAEFSQVAARKLAISSEDSYRIWIGKFLRFLDTPECRRLDASERKVEGFLSDIRTTAGYARKECLGLVSPLDNFRKHPKD